MIHLIINQGIYKNNSSRGELFVLFKALSAKLATRL